MLLCAMSVCATAQEHMSFKGIPMDCDLITFVSKLEAKGFTNQRNTSETSAWVKGNFAGIDDCEILILSTSTSKLVWKVVVYFPERISWYSLKREYNNFKDSYTEKYGKPNSYEYFSQPYYEGDGYELQALKLEKCTYESFFKTTLGYICLSIYKTNQVKVSYEDAVNVILKSSEKEKKVSNDI